MRNSDVKITGTWNGFLSGFRWLLLLGFVISALTCCEGNVFEWLADDNSYEARIEEALIAMDDGNYRRAQDILTGLKAEFPNDGKVAQYLSNAIAGGAGLDTFNLLETIDLLNEAGNTGDIDMVGKVLGDANGNLTEGDITEKLEQLSNAIQSLTDLGEDYLTADQQVQVGLLSLNHAALIIAAVMADNTGEQTIQLTEAGIQQLYGGTTVDLTGIDDELIELSADVTNISRSILVIASLIGGGAGNDLSESFENFRNDVAGTDDVVTEDELENFLQTISQSQ